jgi:uncharacterized protein
MTHFALTLSDGEVLDYETDGATLLRAGERIDLSRFAYSYTDVPADVGQAAFSPDAPLVGKSAPRILKIQLGLGCNYSCTYCSQGGQKEELTSTDDAENFDLEWAEGVPDKVEFWGGEPLLYWKKLQALVPKIDAKWPNVPRSIVSNGTLLTRERIDWLFDNGFSVALSHDGPGQSLRGDDPLEDLEMRRLWQYLFLRFGERASINAVLTAENHDLFDLWMWFEERLGTVRVNVEDVVTDYGGAEMTQAQLEAVYRSVKRHASSGLAMAFPRIRWSMLQFMATLALAKPLMGGHQVCGMDRTDQLAVDLNGNVLTCQNAGAASGHKIGRVEDLAGVTLNTSTSYMSRPNCAECPVVHLCYGSCMFLADKEFESSCRSSYWFNRAVLEGVVYLLTGKEVVEISGWKPAQARRVIPIKVTA